MQSEATTLLPSTSSASAAPAKTLAPLASELASAVLRAAFSTSAAESLASFAPSGSSSKTLLRALLDGSTLRARSWSSSAMRRFRSRLQQAIAALRTDEAGSSLLPTLSAQSYGSNQGGAAGRSGKIRYSLEALVKRDLLPTLTRIGNLVAPSMQKWPSHQRLMPTLLASHPESLRDRKGLSLLPTLCARDEKGPGPAHTKAGSDLPQAVGGRLSPTFCEWYMGFPVGFTTPIAIHFVEQAEETRLRRLSHGRGDLSVADKSQRSATRARRSKPKSSATSSDCSSKPQGGA